MKNKSSDSKFSSLDRFSKEWYRKQPENIRNLFENTVLFFFTMLAAYVYVFSKSEGEAGYNNAHWALTFSCIIIFLLMLLKRSDYLKMIYNFKKAILNLREISLIELTDAILTLCALLAVVAILFVIDLSFFTDYGIRITAVAAVGFVTILKAIFQSFKK